MRNLTESTEWQALLSHHHDIADQHLRDWFLKDTHRFSRFSLHAGGILLDYSRNRVTDQTLTLLTNLAHAIDLSGKIESLFKGDPINSTEKRPALHTALRDKNHTPIMVKGENIAVAVAKAQEQMRDVVNQLHTSQWLGVTGKPIKHIVNIGIGGSHLGPLTCTYALKAFAVSDLQFHFISCVDNAPVDELLSQIDPETTLFILSSKSFSTIETLTNAETILAWMKARLGHDVIKRHFIAITAKIEKAAAFGIPEEHIFPLWDWVGGRYSIWSAIGLPLMLMIGYQHFMEFLEGAHEMDQHFRLASFKNNMPVLLGLLGIWNSNFFGATSHVIAPYSHSLRYLPSYLQQADMESSGKRIDLDGNTMPYTTGSVIFGESGCNGQHSYHQLLHQGQQIIPVDFILVGNSEKNLHQDILTASALSQALALMRGKTYQEAYDELIAGNYSSSDAEKLAAHQVHPGNRPSNILFLEGMTPKSLGSLIALYEHKIFVQGAIWGINPFDQWGVELGKQLLPGILRCVQNASQTTDLDSATLGIIHHIQKGRA